MIKQRKKVFISLLHYKAYDQLKNCLLRLAKLPTSKGFSLNIIVVDNESNEIELRKIKKLFPKAIFLPQKTNIGVPAGFNVGYRYGIQHGADYLVMLSPDLLLEKFALHKLFLKIDNDPTIGIACCKMLIKTKPPQIFFVQGKLDPKTKTSIHIGLGDTKITKYDKYSENDFLNCPMIIRREVFEKIGYFEPKLFMYYEDLDWHTRIKKAGFKLVCVKDALAWNLDPDQDGSVRPKKEYYLARNRLWFVNKHFSFTEQINSYVHLMKEIFVLFFNAKKEKERKRLKYILLGTLDYFLNKYGEKKIDFV